MHEQPRKERHYLGWLLNQEGSKKVAPEATLYMEKERRWQKPAWFCKSEVRK